MINLWVAFVFSGCRSDHFGYSSKPCQNLEEYQVYGGPQLDKNKVINLFLKFSVVLLRLRRTKDCNIKGGPLRKGQGQSC